MTKEFCDHCGTEMEDRVRIRISFLGNTSRRFVNDNVSFCEVCFHGIENEIYKYIPARTVAIA